MAPPKSLTDIKGTYPVAGIQAGTVGKPEDPLRKVPQRMDLDEWFLSEDPIHRKQRSLFFPAFQRFCQEDPESKFSFFQIAGIHGQPLKSWDEPQGSEGSNGRTWYCHHGETTFTTWHRPYMLLFEQVIYEYMKDYASSTFSGAERATMLTAADQWRLPYWDWASKKPIDYKHRDGPVDYNLPRAFLDRGVDIQGPKGPDKVDNALYQFTMPGGMTMGGTGGKLSNDLKIRNAGSFAYSQCKSTSRHPTGDKMTQAWLDGVQNNDALVNVLRDNKIKYKTAKNSENPSGVMNESLRDAYSRLFSIERFEDFASTQPAKRLEGQIQDIVYNNCESLHNSMHGWCGGSPKLAWGSGTPLQQGHMSDPSVAAFDPLFWFHHCNIDRTIAIWQAIGDLRTDKNAKDNWFDASRNKFSAAAETGDLQPFHKKDGTYWKSADSRSTVALGYTYPILDKHQPGLIDAKGAYQRQKHLGKIIQDINEQYNSARTAAAKAALTADPGRSGPHLMKLSALLASVPESSMVLDQTVHDYAVNILYEKMGFRGQTFTISVFIGRVPSTVPFDFHDPENSLVGQVYNFTSPDEGETRCENCAEQAVNHTLATGRIVLTNSLITRWKQALVHTPEPADGVRVLGSMEPTDVVEFLKANLHWRVTGASGLVEVAEIPSIKVSVVVGKAEHFADVTKLSKYYDYRPAYQVTEGKAGGAGSGDGLYPGVEAWRP